MLRGTERRHNNESTQSLENCGRSNPLELYSATIDVRVTTVQGNNGIIADTGAHQLE